MSNVFSSVTNQSGAALKRAYEEGIVDQLNEDNVIYKACEKIKKSSSGEAVYPALRVRRNQGIGAGDDGGNMPSIGKDTVVQAKVDWKYLWLRTGLTAGMIAASKNEKGAFLRQIDWSIKSAYKDFSNEMNRMLSYDGTGALARLSAAAVASQTITVEGREGTNEPGNKFIDVGMTVDIYSSAGVQKAAGVGITAISGTSTATLTLDTPVTAAATDILVRANSYNKEVQGLLYALGNTQTGSVYEVNRDTYPIFQSNVLNAAGAQVTLDSLQNVYNEGLRRGGTANGTYRNLMCDYDSHRFLQKLYSADKRYINTNSMDGGGWKKDKPMLDFNGVPVTPDKDFPQRYVFLAEECLQIFELNSLEMANETGSNLIAQTDSDSFEIRFRYFLNMFNKQPAAFGVLRNYISP